MNNKRKITPAKMISPKNEIPDAVQQLANQHNLDAALLRSWKVYPHGKVVLVAANGMKFIHEGYPDADIG